MVFLTIDQCYHFFILDNTNYGNPILARINSILEGDDTILINEYHSNGTSINL